MEVVAVVDLIQCWFGLRMRTRMGISHTRNGIFQG